MSIIIENEYEGEINIPYEKIAHEVIEAAIDYVDCPYECEVNLMLTDKRISQELKKIRWHLIQRAVNFYLEIS